MSKPGRPKSAKPGTRSMYHQQRREGKTPDAASLRANAEYMRKYRGR